MEEPAPPPHVIAPPRPYAWKTDEFQTDVSARRTGQYPAPAVSPGYQPPALAFRCPRCMSHLAPKIEKRISTAGWITFAVLLVFFFPLFWIGFFIKEDVQICPVCNSTIPVKN